MVREGGMKMVIGEWTQRPWGEPWADEPALITAALAIMEIGLSRGMCYGPCPVYVVRLYRSGRAGFLGEHFVDLMGPHEAEIAPEDMDTLALAVTSLGFDHLEPNYATGWTDASTTRTWIATQTGVIQVADDGGAGPRTLRLIEGLIDAAASELRWRPVAGETHGDDGLPLFVGLDVTETWRPPTGRGTRVHWTQARGASGPRPSNQGA